MKRVFVAGATGVLGRRVVANLVADGHSVFGSSRSKQNETILNELGAEPRAVDLFNRDSVVQATRDCDLILHLATAIPDKMRTRLSDWAANDRLRRETTEHLVAASQEHDAALIVQSITFLYGDKAGANVDETSAIGSELSPILTSAVDMEATVFAAEELQYVILRFGSFYCWDSTQTQDLIKLVRRGRYGCIGKGDTFWNVIHVDDAATAICHAVASTKNREVYNICDDQSVTPFELGSFLGETLGTQRSPLLVPKWMANIALGSHTVRTLTASHRASNTKAKRDLGWTPRYPSFREGYEQVLANSVS